MYRIANALSCGLRKALSSGKIGSKIKLGQESSHLHPFTREEFEFFKRNDFWWRNPMILTGPSRCGKTTFINQYLQQSPNWFIIKHNRQVVESCDMDIAKSLAVAYNSHIENLERIYEDSEIPKSNQDRWNINRYLLRAPKIKVYSDYRFVTRCIYDAITNHHNIYKREKLFTLFFDDFDSIHLMDKPENANQLLNTFRVLGEEEMVKTIFIGKNPYLIYAHLRGKINYCDQQSFSLGYLSKSDMMKYLQKKTNDTVD